MELEISGLPHQHETTLEDTPDLDLGKLTGSVHFIGIGGIGMSAIAQMLLAQGVTVSGSDKEENSSTQQLRKLGADIKIGHQAGNIERAGLIVVSTAITNENPEYAAAAARNLPIWHRSKILYYIGRQSKMLSVSGTHGKTTTTGMLAEIFLDAGLDPKVVVGGVFERIASNAHTGAGEYFIAEADESDGSHVQCRSYASIITNIEADHLENYPGGLEQIRANMATFANNSQKLVVLCLDDPGCRLIRGQIRQPVVTYGRHDSAVIPDYSYQSKPGFAMTVYKSGNELGDIVLAVPGEHNKLNALGAAALAMEMGVSFAAVKSALESFKGVCRRFQHLGNFNGITIVDDYAHHPTEVVATLQAARQYLEQNKSTTRVVAVFQPHQPGRLRDLWEDFCASFGSADLVLIADIYIARGNPIDGISSETFVQAIKHDNVHHVAGSANQLAKRLLAHLQSGDLVLTIGAGDITKVGPEILRMLKQGSTNG